ncbi:MAG: hypothetical protein ACP5HD_09190 [Thermoproteus sp.]|jgi:hypothetical protein
MGELLLAAVALGALHMAAPDHWAPLAASLARRRYGGAALVAVSALVGLTHGVLSVALALIAALAGSYVLPMAYIKYVSIALLAALSVGVLIDAVRGGGIDVGGSAAVSVLPDPAAIP